MKFMILLMLSISFIFPAFADDHKEAKKITKNQKTFGGKITQTKVVALNDVVGNFDKYKGKVVTFEATPKKVCKKSGCWMVLEDGKKEVRTLFKDYGFFVPATIVGKKVRVQGVMEKKTISAATRRHYMKDAGAKFRDMKKIKSSTVQFQFTADAVEII